MVYVLDMNGVPLMPCSPMVAKLLLKSGKAKVKRRTPFTIKLNYKTRTEVRSEVTLGIDTGSSVIGSSAVDGNGNVLYLAEVTVRNDIKKKMDQRRSYRRNRRNRKTRYRASRWQNRKNSKRKDRFSPTMTSKINSHLKEINFVKSILPISKVILETGTFDPHALKNPTVLQNKWLYQKGINYGFANSKTFVLNRDKYSCRVCGAKKCGLEVHHMVFRSNGGSDEPENLITLCRSCHKKVHLGELDLSRKGKKKGTLNHATQMNSIRVQLLKRVESEETFGFVTKEHRQNLGLSKEHWADAVAIASRGKEIQLKVNQVIRKKCVSKGDYQQNKGIRGEQRIETGKICGFRKFDKVLYQGNEYFIKGRMSSGYAILMDIDGQKVDFSHLGKGLKTPNMNNLTRIGSRKSWIMSQKTIAEWK